MAYYLNKRDQIPGWEVGSVMPILLCFAKYSTYSFGPQSDICLVAVGCPKLLA